MAKNEKQNVKQGMGVHARRAIAYVTLIIISFFCLFWFYILIINATRSNGEMSSGFTAIPSTHLLENWKNLLAGTLPVWSGMLNSLIVAVGTAVLCVYFSTMTAYAIHAYDFKIKKVCLSVYIDDYDDSDTGNSAWFCAVDRKSWFGGFLYSTDCSSHCISGNVLLYEAVDGKFIAVVID